MEILGIIISAIFTAGVTYAVIRNSVKDITRAKDAMIDLDKSLAVHLAESKDHTRRLREAEIHIRNHEERIQKLERTPPRTFGPLGIGGSGD